MRQQQARPTWKSIEDDLTHAWKLLNQLAKVLTRIATDTATLSNTSTNRASLKTNTQHRSKKAPVGNPSGKKAALIVQGTKDLPNTSGDFFIQYVTKNKQVPAQIFQSMLKSLSYTPTKEQSAILRNRMNVWLSNAAKSQTSSVRSTGSGRQRQYYRS